MLCRYPEARAIQRKIVYHAGPTNSGKTHHALERFMNAKSGVYCGPLRLLAFQVFQKLNDLVSVNLSAVFLLLIVKGILMSHADPLQHCASCSAVISRIFYCSIYHVMSHVGVICYVMHMKVKINN